MSVLIKDVDRDLYAKFKAAAALRGLRLNDALCQAMKIWIEDNSPKTETDRERIENNAAYRRLIPDLLQNHEGEWVVISGGELIGIFPNRNAALECVRDSGLLGKCNLVSPVKATKRKVTLGFGRRLS
jgi:hypothetical protein